MPTWKKITIGILIFFLALSMYKPLSDLFGWDNKEDMLQNTQQSSVTGTLMGNVREFDVIGSNYMFQPGLMRVKKGETIKIIFHNIEGLHDFRIDELNVATQLLEEKDTQTVEFAASKIGTFEYYCSVKNHKALGMTGKIIIE
jgi:plastocyanin